MHEAADCKLSVIAPVHVRVQVLETEVGRPRYAHAMLAWNVFCTTQYLLCLGKVIRVVCFVYCMVSAHQNLGGRPLRQRLQDRNGKIMEIYQDKRLNDFKMHGTIHVESSFFT